MISPIFNRFFMMLWRKMAVWIMYPQNLISKLPELCKGRISFPPLLSASYIFHRMRRKSPRHTFWMWWMYTDIWYGVTISCDHNCHWYYQLGHTGQGLVILTNFSVKSLLVDGDFLKWLLIGWWLQFQPIRILLRKLRLSDRDFTREQCYHSKSIDTSRREVKHIIYSIILHIQKNDDYLKYYLFTIVSCGGLTISKTVITQSISILSKYAFIQYPIQGWHTHAPYHLWRLFQNTHTVYICQISTLCLRFNP